jgi:hypothetical protein
MGTTILIPIAAYDRWLRRCPRGSQEYVCLRNGVLEHDKDGSSYVRLLCDAETAKALMDSAKRLCPEVVRQIKQTTESRDPGAAQGEST